jgi:hypothetical protein
MKLAIIGSRSFQDYDLLCQTMDKWFYEPRGGTSCPMWLYNVREIVSGGAAGADSLGARWAREQGIKLTEFKPDWEKHGRRAGFIRNEDIVAASDVVLSFWDGVSRGTANSLSIAKRLKKPTIIIYF